VDERVAAALPVVAYVTIIQRAEYVSVPVGDRTDEVSIQR
jgi:hypothetical protein